MNKDKRNNIKLLGTLNNSDESGIIANANQIYDANEDKSTQDVSKEHTERIKTLEDKENELIAAVGTGGSVDTRITNAVNVEKTRAEGAESTLDGKITAEQTRAANAENALDGRVDTLEEAVGTGGSVDSKIASAVATETSRAQEAEANRYTKNETYTKEEVNNLITTPNQEYVSVTATDQTTAVTDVLPATGAADRVYRVGNWDGSQYDAACYSEYAWNGSAYVHLGTKTQIGEVFDISVYHATGGTLATYDNLKDALGTNGNNIPQSLRKGGMSVKFVQSSDNKYVQFRLMADSFSTTVTDWQGVDDEPIAGSNNLVKSGGIAKMIREDSNNDLSFSDENGNTIAYFKGGHIKTKNFLSSTLNQIIFDSTDQTTNKANYGTIEDLDQALTPGIFLWKQKGKQAGIVQCFLDNMNHALTQILCTNYQLTDSDNNVLNFTEIADKDSAKKGTFSLHQHTMHTYVRTYGYTDNFADNQSSAQKLEKGWSSWVGLLLDSEWYSNLKLICQSWFKDFSDIIIDDGQDDFSIQDEARNILCLWKDGHIKTKNFNSEKVNEKLDTIESGAQVNQTYVNYNNKQDLSLDDENGNAIVVFKDGHIKTRNFDSTNVNEKLVGNDIVLRNTEAIQKMYSVRRTANPIDYQKGNWEKSVTILNVTDTHSDKDRWDNFVRLSDYINPDVVVHTGDAVLTDLTNDYSYMLNNLPKNPMLFAIGNHDVGDYEKTLSNKTATNSAAKNIFIDPMATKYGYTANNLYYYYDCKDVRIIIINNYECDANDGTNFVVPRGRNILYSQQQINWLIDTLDDAITKDLSVVICAHECDTLLYASQARLPDGSTSKFLDKVHQSNAFYKHYSENIICDIIEAYINGASINKTYTQLAKDFERYSWGDYIDITQLTDFSTINVNHTFSSPGKFVTWLVGHRHSDVIGKLPNYKQLMCVFAASAIGFWQSNNDGQAMEDSDLPRKKDTVTEDCFTSLSIDTSAKTIGIVRFGSTIDYRLNKRDAEIISYDI